VGEGEQDEQNIRVGEPAQGRMWSAFKRGFKRFVREKDLAIKVFKRI